MKISKSTEWPDRGDAEEQPGTIYSIEIGTDGMKVPPDFEKTVDALMDALELHYHKALDYDGAEQEFGVKGEIFGITRKVRKLKRVVWDGRDPLYEGAQEMTMDLIGNSLLMLRMLKGTSDKYAALWRDNHGNKPKFGPRLGHGQF